MDSNLAATACLRCRGQKLRCSRELPICARCKRLNANCVFPEPPHKKARQAPARHSRNVPTANVKVHSDEGYGSPSEHNSRQGLSRRSSMDGSPIPRDLQLMLIEVLYLCFFHMPLMFHRATMMQSIAEGTMPEHLMQSMFALASIYVDTPLVKAKFGIEKVEALGDPKLLGIGCATRSSSEVLKSIDTPSLDSSRTCLLLGLYWFSRGDSNRNSMFLGISNRAARALCRETIAMNPGKDWLTAELERRTFWGTWIANCVNCDHYINGTSADTFVLNLPLPVSDAAFEQDRSEQPISTLGNTADVASAAVPRPAPWNNNALAEMLRLVLHWAKIHDHIEARKSLPAKQSLVNLLDLDYWLTNWARTLSSTLKYAKLNLYEQVSIKKQSYYVTMHSMFYQCRMVLHASVVPQFGGLVASEEISPETIRISAETALNNANAMAELAADLIALEVDPSQFPAFVGYTCYVSATIHMSMLSSANSALSMAARKGLTSTLNILKRMKPYWTNLNRLWARVHILYEAQLSRMPASSKAHLNMTSSPIGDPSSDLDHIANMKREVGRLTEPLSDSVLQYSSDRLRKLIDVDESSSAARDLEKAMAQPQPIESDVSEISGRDILPDTSSNGYDPTYGGILADNFGEGAQAYNQAPLLSSDPTVNATSGYDPYLIDGMDWSQFDMNSLLLPFGTEDIEMPMTGEVPMQDVPAYEGLASG